MAASFTLYKPTKRSAPLEAAEDNARREALVMHHKRDACLRAGERNPTQMARPREVTGLICFAIPALAGLRRECLLESGDRRARAFSPAARLLASLSTVVTGFGTGVATTLRPPLS